MLNNDSKMVAKKHLDECIMNPNAYWQIAISVIDTWRQSLRRKNRFENAPRIMPLIDVEYDGNLCKLEEEIDEYNTLVDICLSMFDYACVLFDTEPIDRGWLLENANSCKACKRLGVEIKKLMHRGRKPVSLKSI